MIALPVRAVETRTSLSRVVTADECVLAVLPPEDAEHLARVLNTHGKLRHALGEIVSQIDQGGASGKVFGRDACIGLARAALADAEGGAR